MRRPELPLRGRGEEEDPRRLRQVEIQPPAVQELSEEVIACGRREAGAGRRLFRPRGGAAADSTALAHAGAGERGDGGSNALCRESRAEVLRATSQHNFGPGHQHLSGALATLAVLAFLIDKVQEHCCPMFRQALAGRKRKLCLRLTLWSAMTKGCERAILKVLDGY